MVKDSISRAVAVTIVTLIGASGATLHAQTMRILSSPDVGAVATISAGDEIYSFQRLYTIEGAKLEVDTKAGTWLIEKRLAKGTELVPVISKSKFKACLPAEGTFEPEGPCLLDDDGDGFFDRQSGEQYEIARKIKPPIPYSKSNISLVRSDAFKRVFLFQGATADSLNFSYREFSDGLARPAFTENLTVPREKFPAMVRIKNIQLEILGVSGMGLQYRVVKVN